MNYYRIHILLYDGVSNVFASAEKSTLYRWSAAGCAMEERMLDLRAHDNPVTTP